MSFLAPLFLFGALAVALPIVVHLIRRTSKEKMTFSSLMFLQPAPPRVTRRNRLENIFLLLLRCLVLGLLSLGFARPFFQKPMVPDPQSGAGDQPAPAQDRSLRRLVDGREFRIVKVYYEPAELRAALLRAGFASAEVTTTGRFFLLGRVTA